MPIKVAFIGAGSITFTRKLMNDILAVPELQDTVFAFTDINRANCAVERVLWIKGCRERGKDVYPKCVR